VIVDDALYALPEGGSAKVHQQAKRQVHEAEIGQHLFAVDSGDPLDRFQFDEQFSFDQQIGAKAFIDDEVIKANCDRLLALHRQSATRQTLEQDRFVNRFEQPRPKPFMQFEPAINGYGGQRFYIHTRKPSSRLRVSQITQAGCARMQGIISREDAKPRR
jgi:hypothetical protein